jgi:hypothetical protein
MFFAFLKFLGFRAYAGTSVMVDPEIHVTGGRLRGYSVTRHQRG